MQEKEIRDRTHEEIKRVLDLEVARKILAENPRVLACKSQCYALYSLGMFGNRALAWDSLQELLNSGYRDLICMRGRAGVPRRRVDYNIPFDKIEERMREWEAEGISRESITFNQSMPDEHIVLQGEVGKFPLGLGLSLHYTRVQKPMNLALAEKAEDADGTRARAILEHFLWPSSLEHLYDLLDLYPNTAIEFSAYNIPVGDIPNRNTVIWEVRNY